MVTAATSPPKLVATDMDNSDADPFVSPAHSHNSHSSDLSRRRYAGFDNQLFSIYSEGSPSQTKRALEAHLAETERRLQEASQLGTVLVQQRKELSERLKEVERQQDATEIGPELRAKLVELEREFNEVGKDTARAFIPKTRVPSSHSNQFVDSDGNSIFSSEAQPSPSKLSVPSRKQRNQQPNRIHDIKLATEISSSLLNQVRELQAALAEKDELLKAIDVERSQLEIEVEGLTQRLRALDESEQRYKDENWNLETRIQELLMSAKESADKEHRLSGNLNTAKSEKSALERELEELRQAHAKLDEEHQTTYRQHEAEIIALRRNVSSGETERGALQRKIDELISQNEELVRAVTYRQRAEESGSGRDSGLDAEDAGSGRSTPDLSPPPSPSKFTPRHGQLETETLKSSLQHAHRMIQNLKNNIHREKTEKMELRRVLQETKDELDIARREAAGAPGSAVKKRRPNEKQELFKKPPRPDRLGMARGARDEIFLDDGDWEDNDEDDIPETPSRRPLAIGGVGLSPFGRRISQSTLNSNKGSFQAATDTSDAFETAHEADTTTETEAFHTGAETLDGDDTDEMTETEIQSLANTVRNRRSSRLSQAQAGNRDSYLSTASTSGDENDPSDTDIRTPKRIEQPRYRLKVSRGGRRSLPSTAEVLNENAHSMSKSPSQSFVSMASFRSDGSQYEPDGGKSLLAELGNMSGEDSEMMESEPGTPGSMLSPKGSPDLRRHIANQAITRKASLAKPPMVDSSMNTEPWEPASKGIISSTSAALGAAIAGGVGFVAGRDRDSSATPTESPRQLAPSAIEEDAFSETSQQTAIEAASANGEALAAASTAAAEEEAVTAPTPTPLDFSVVETQQIEPLEPEVKTIIPPTLNVSSISSLALEPEALELAVPAVPKLDLSSVFSLHSEPIAPEVPVPQSLTVSSISSLHSVPEALELVTTPKPTPPALEFSSISSLDSTPEALELAPTPKAIPSVLELSSVSSLHSEEPVLPSLPAPEEIKPQPHNFQISSISSLQLEPVAAELPAPREVKPEPSNSQLSSILSLQSEPVAAELPAAPKIVLPALELSSISSLHSEPVALEAPKSPEVAPSAFSPVFGQEIEPIAPQVPEASKVTPSSFSLVSGQAVEPVSLPFPEVFSRQAPLVVDPSAPEEGTPVPVLSYADISSQHVEPEEAKLPERAVAAVGTTMAFDDIDGQISQGKQIDAAVENNQQARRLNIDSGRPDSQTIPEKMPFMSITSNVSDIADSTPVKSKVPMAEQGTQTMVSSEELDRLFKERSIAGAAIVRSVSPTTAPSTADSMSSSPKKDVPSFKTPRRPSSVQSVRSRGGAPPLPADHKEVIAAASQRSAQASTMAPPKKPASASKSQNSSHASQLRPRTPSGDRPVTPQANRDGTTPRPLRTRSSEISSPVSRRTSVSSFASELDSRFNIPVNPVAREGFDSNTDPRMIQAITQTMIGEYLWKYTRKAGREEMSVNRHRRFFWVHPYTRTLYWSDQDPATAGKTQLKAKSVQIEDVRVETDDNPFPPGLHRKSLIVITPGRAVKFTATTGQRHETWFNALSYLLLRTSQERDDASMTPEEAHEFNPSYSEGRSASRQTARSRMSLSSYNSRTTRTSSPYRSQVPSLTQRKNGIVKRAGTPGSTSGRFSSLSGMFIPPGFRGSFSSRRSRTSGPGSSIYDASVVHDSAEDLRQVIQAQEDQADRLENVRACCDGKHDVGSLSHKPPKQLSAHHHHYHSHRKPSHSRKSSFGASTALSHGTEIDAHSNAE